MPAAYLSAQTLPAGTAIPGNMSDLAMPPFNAHLLINLTQPLLPSGQLRRAQHASSALDPLKIEQSKTLNPSLGSRMWNSYVWGAPSP